MVIFVEMEKNFIKMVLLCIKEIMPMMKLKGLKNIFMKMVIIISDNGKLEIDMEKEYIIIKMALFIMMANMLMINKKGKENAIMMGIII